MTNESLVNPIGPGDVRLAEKILVWEAQKGVKLSEYKNLLPEISEMDGILRSKLPIILVGGREKGRFRVGYDHDGVPLVPLGHPLARLHMSHAHQAGHGGASATLMRSRQKVWIPQGGKIAKSIKFYCVVCKRRDAKCQEQKMAPLPEFRLKPAPIFNTVAVDLFGPLTYRDMVKRRVTGKGWGVVFVCMMSTAVHLELTEAYSTDAFLMAFRRFICMRGTPSLVISDRGSQLVEAASEVAGWDFARIQEWSAARKFEWRLVPTQGQHQNGLAERMVGLVKKTLGSTVGEKECTYGELVTVLQEAALIVNSRPIGIQGKVEDLEVGGAITPLHLMLGRATAEAPEVLTERASLTTRLVFIQDLQRSFWNKWRAVVFQGRDRSYRWRTHCRDLRVGDVVLLKDESATTRSYRLGRVTKVFRSEADNFVRSVLVAYKNPGQKKFRLTERPVQRLVLLLPIEEQGDYEPPEVTVHESTEDTEGRPHKRSVKAREPMRQQDYQADIYDDMALDHMAIDEK